MVKLRLSNLIAITVLLIMDGLLTAMPARSQDTPDGISVPGSLPFGRDVCELGDVDGDGVADLCASQPTAGETASGVVVAVSGKSGKALWATLGGLGNEHFGMSIGVTWDVDGDGIRDVVSGGPFASSKQEGEEARGVWRLLSGRTGATLRAEYGGDPGGEAGWSVCGLGAPTGAGPGGVAIGAPGGGIEGESRCGKVVAFAGRTGKARWVREGVSAGSRFGHSLADCGDVDGDGQSDLAVGAPLESVKDLQRAGSVTMLSGSSGRALWRRPGRRADDGLGEIVKGVGDWNGDGVPDVLVGAPFAMIGAIQEGGYCVILSGADGVELWRRESPDPDGHFGWRVASAGSTSAQAEQRLYVSAPGTRNSKDIMDPAYDYTGSIVAIGRGKADVLWRVRGADMKGARFGSTLVACRDRDGDGVEDVLALAMDDVGVVNLVKGRLLVLSGADGRVLATIRQPVWREVARPAANPE